jgi:hypothetical protein
MAAFADGSVTEENPPLMQPGMTEIGLDAQGRLRGFLAVPVQMSPGAPTAIEGVFKAAQLDFSKFAEVAPETIPQVAADKLQVWEGPHPVIPGMRLHIEAGWWQGRVTYVNFRWPWTKRSGPVHYNAWISEIQGVLFLLVTAIVLLFAVLLGRRNWKLERSNRNGAFVVGMAMFTLSFLNWALSMHAVPSRYVLNMVVHALATATFNGAIFLLLYLALEPALRARWPHSIITWNRVLAGRWKDAQLASDILIGTAVGTLFMTLVAIHDSLLASRWKGIWRMRSIGRPNWRCIFCCIPRSYSSCCGWAW